MKSTGFPIRLLVLMFVLSSAPAVADGYRIEFEPEPKFSVDPDTGEFRSDVDFGLVGSGWGPLQGLRNSFHEIKHMLGAESDPNESGLYNYYPDIVLPKISDILSKSVLLSWVLVRADTEPDQFAPLPEEIDVLDGLIRTSDGYESPISVTAISNLLQLPAVQDLGYGPIEYEWNLSAHFSAEQLDPNYSAHYIWLTSEVPLIHLIPEPHSLCMILIWAAVCRRGR
jgi:hypothetical protein